MQLLLRYIECILLLNMETDLLLSDETYILGIYHSIGKFSHVRLSQHNVWNATGPNIFKTGLPAIQGCYLESTGYVVSNTSVTKDGVRVLTGGN